MPVLTVLTRTDDERLIESELQRFPEHEQVYLIDDQIDPRQAEQGAELVVEPQAVITRSRLYQVPVLVNLGGEGSPVCVNGRRVVQFRVLRHGNRVQLGRVELKFWEMTLQRAYDDSDQVRHRQRCPVCAERFIPRHEIILCPRCGEPHHKACFLALEVCSNPAGCQYPVRATLRRALTDGNVRSEILAANSAPVTEKMRCPANMLRADREPFRPNQTVVYCPNPTCEKPMHLECWLYQEKCPHCGSYDIAQKLRSLFVPGEPAYGEEQVTRNYD